MFKKIISSMLITAILISIIMVPVHASSVTYNIDIFYSESISDSNYENELKAIPIDMVGTVLGIIASYGGITYGSGYAVGVFCKNAGWSYAVSISVAQTAATAAGGLVGGAIFFVGFNNGWNSV